MKKLLCALLALVVVAGCSKKEEAEVVEEKEEVVEETTDETTEETAVMSYEEFMAADMDSDVTVEAYVQGNQSWWDNKITVYAQDEDGGYFFYEMACEEEDAPKLFGGTKIRVTGTKTEWAGEVEIADATFEIIDGSWIAEPVDVTDKLGTDELIEYMNQKVSFKDMTIDKVEYKNDEPGDDIYVTASNGDNTVNFCVEVYLTPEVSEVYNCVGTLAEGDVVDIDAFLYWYEGANPHIINIVKK